MLLFKKIDMAEKQPYLYIFSIKKNLGLLEIQY